MLLGDYETESKRLTVLNQRFAFLMNGLNYVKLRQASSKDMIYEVMEKRIFGVLEGLLSTEISNTVVPTPTTPASPNNTTSKPKLELL